MPTAKTTTNPAKPTPRSTTARGAARKPAKPPSTARSSASNSRSAATTGDSPLGAYAERAVLIPVGAALIARERVAAGIGDTIANYNSTAKVNAQLRRFERRGHTARKRVERELRKTRVRVEREVRQTRTRVEREVKRRRRDGEELASRVQERLLDIV
jgi:hypothetical protein